jgi:hypothetical protein
LTNQGYDFVVIYWGKQQDLSRFFLVSLWCSSLLGLGQCTCHLSVFKREGVGKNQRHLSVLWFFSVSFSLKHSGWQDIFWGSTSGTPSQVNSKGG